MPSVNPLLLLLLLLVIVIGVVGVVVGNGSAVS